MTGGEAAAQAGSDQAGVADAPQGTGTPSEGSDVVIPTWDDVSPTTEEGEAPSAATDLSWMRATGFVGVGAELDEARGSGVWAAGSFAVETGGPLVEAVTGERIRQSVLYAPTRAELVVRSGEGGGPMTVSRAEASTALIGMRIAEYAGEQRTASAMGRYAVFAYKRDLALDRRHQFETSLTDIHAELVLPQSAGSRTLVNLSLTLPGYRYIEFDTNRQYYNGARLLGAGIELSQEFGPFGALVLEPYAGGHVDVALGSLRKKTFATDTLIDASCGLRVSITRHIQLDGGVEYVVGINTERRGGNPSTWRAFARLLGRF